MDNDFNITPSNTPYPARLNTVGLKLQATSKRGLGDYESVNAECTVFFSFQSGASNEDVSETLHAYRGMVEETLATLLDDGRDIVRSGVAGRKVKKFLGLPVMGAAVEVETTTTTLPAPAPMALGTAREYKTSMGVSFGELDLSEIKSGIAKLETRMLENQDLTPGDLAVILNRRSALYVVLATKQAANLPDHLDDECTIDPRDGMPFGDK